MRTWKVLAEVEGPDPALGRQFHLDVHDVGAAPPELLVLFFGGSGKSEADYRGAEAQTYPGLREALLPLDAGRGFRLVFVTAPFDVPYAAFTDRPVDLQRWRVHVLAELLPLAWSPGRPVYFGSFSGGLILWHSVQELVPTAFGATALGADGMDEEFAAAPSWASAPRFVYTAGDPLRDRNAKVLAGIARRGDAVVEVAGQGGHALPDYWRAGHLAGLVSRAFSALDDSGLT